MAADQQLARNQATRGDVASPADLALIQSVYR